MKTTIIIDCGNSETRLYATTTGQTDSYSAILSNSFAKEAVSSQLDDYIDGGSYNNDNSTALSFARRNHLGIKGSYVSGDLLSRNYERNAQRPGLNTPKHEDALVTVALVNAIDKTVTHFAKHSKEKVSKKRFVELNDINVVLLVPPTQVKSATKGFQEKFVDNTVTYTNRFDNETYDLKISSVKVLPEGMAAYVALRTTANGSLRQGYEFLDTKNVLILDVGAGTTDVIGVSNGQLMEASQYTIQKGGRHILDIVKKNIQKEKGRTLSETLFEDTFNTGTVTIGNDVVDCIDAIDEGLDAVSSQIARELSEHFATTTVELASFNHLVVVGGGSLQWANGRENLPALSELLLEEIKRDVPDIDLINTNDISEEIFENTVFNGKPTRYLNLWGAVILTKLIG